MIEVEKAGYNPNRDSIGRFSSGGGVGGGGAGAGGAGSGSGAEGGSNNAEASGAQTGSDAPRPGSQTLTPLEAVDNDEFIGGMLEGTLGDSPLTEGWEDSDFELAESLNNQDWVTAESDLRPSWAKPGSETVTPMEAFEDSDVAAQILFNAGGSEGLTQGWAESDFELFESLPNQDWVTDGSDLRPSWEKSLRKTALAQGISEGVIKTDSWSKADWVEFNKELSKGLKDGGDTLKLISIDRYAKSTEGIADLQKSLADWEASGTRAVVTGIIKGQFYSAAYRGKLV